MRGFGFSRTNLETPVNYFNYHTTHNFLTFLNTTAIAYRQKIDKSLRILVSCNSSRIYKCQKITSTVKTQIIGQCATRGNSNNIAHRPIAGVFTVISGGGRKLTVSIANLNLTRCEEACSDRRHCRRKGVWGGTVLWGRGEMGRKKR